MKGRESDCPLFPPAGRSRLRYQGPRNFPQIVPAKNTANGNHPRTIPVPAMPPPRHPPLRILPTATTPKMTPNEQSANPGSPVNAMVRPIVTPVVSTRGWVVMNSHQKAPRFPRMLHTRLATAHDVVRLV